MATLTELSNQFGSDGDWGTAHGCTRISMSSSPSAAPFAELLAETKDKLVNLEIQVAVAATLAQHSDSTPPAVNAAVQCVQSKIGPFRDSLRAIEHAASGLVTALGRATLRAEQATRKLNHVEAEVELLRDRPSGFEDKRMSTGDIAAGGNELGVNVVNQQPLLAYVEAKGQIEGPQAQLATLKAKADAAETRCAEATARVDALEMELARGSTEIAQIRLIHAGMWDSWQAATAELERSSEKCRLFEQEISELRRRAAELDATVNALYGSTSWRVTAPLRWLRSTLSRNNN
jgi:septal ring factor EnvC (AmiA/AmiB activator)